MTPFPVSAKAGAASANRALDRVTTAAPVLMTAMPRLAASATQTVVRLSFFSTLRDYPGSLGRHARIAPGRTRFGAETRGFDPGGSSTPPNRLAGGSFRPLRHVSVAESTKAVQAASRESLLDDIHDVGRLWSAPFVVQHGIRSAD